MLQTSTGFIKCLLKSEDNPAFDKCAVISFYIQEM